MVVREDTMLPSVAPAMVIRSRINTYRAVLVDARWAQAIHSCCVGGEGGCTLNQQCRAVHYGHCSAVKFTPVSSTRQLNGPRTGRAVRIVTKSVKAAAAVAAGERREAPPPVEAAQLRANILRRSGEGVVDAATQQKTIPISTPAATPKTTNLKTQHVPEAAALQHNHAAPTSSEQPAARSRVISEERPATADQPDNNQFLAQKMSQLQLKKDAAAAASAASAKTQKLGGDVRDDNRVDVQENRSSHNSSNALDGDKNAKNSTPKVLGSKSASKKERENTSSLRTTLSASKTAAARKNAEHIDPFYFPLGKPSKQEDQDAVFRNIKEVFSQFENQRATKENMPAVVKAVGLPLYWKACLFEHAGGVKNGKSGHVTLQSFLACWKKLTNQCHDDASKFVRILSKHGHNYLVEDDFTPLVQDVVEHHPGLLFLHEAPEFHSRYVQTVISRILYCVNRSWTGRITVNEIRKSNLLKTIKLIEEQDDINQINDFFSYEHFYVVYCKFWELDKDHDLWISKEDLQRHNDEAISSRMIERIFSGAVTRSLKDGKMSYKDFVWFLISEEDKRSPTSIEYWFRCMDLDGDGVISMYEMQYFYEEQQKKMEALGIETLPFEDTLCLMLDMISPANVTTVSLSDLKNCKMAPLFFDTFFNLDKYLEHEQKDPFANVRDHDSDEPEPTDWERYAAEEYDNLVSEEGANDQEEILYEDDFEPDEEPLPKDAGAVGATGGAIGGATGGAGAKEAAGAKSRANSRDTNHDEDDIYDFSHATS